MAENELEQQPVAPQPVQTQSDDSSDTFDDRIGVMFIILLVLWGVGYFFLTRRESVPEERTTNIETTPIYTEPDVIEDDPEPLPDSVDDLDLEPL